MKAWFKQYWYILVIAAFFIPAAKRPDGSRERLSGFIIRHTVAAIEDTFGAFSFGDGPQQIASTPFTAVPAFAPTAPAAAPAPSPAPTSGMGLSPTVEVTTVEGGQKISGQWLVANGGMATHPNPQIAMSDLKRHMPGNWIAVPMNGTYQFFKKS